MGRITIFTSDNCSHCRRVQAALETRQMPYVQINITRHPEKRQDMMALSQRTSTPQIFFNTRHVGGADDTIQLLHEWDHDKRYESAHARFQQEVEHHFDPSNARFQVPQDPSPVVDPANDDNEIEAIHILLSRGDGDYSIHLPWEVADNGKKQQQKVTVSEMTELLKEIIPSQDTTKGWTVHRMVFTGAHATQAIMYHYQVNTEQAIRLGTHLIEQQVILPRSSSSSTNTRNVAPLENSTKALYRLQRHAEPSILNSYCIWKQDVSSIDPFQLLLHLSNLLSRILMNRTDDDGKIDFLAARAHPLYPQFEEVVCALQQVQFGHMKDQAKTAFGINLYNLMMKYALIKIGQADTDIHRFLFYNNIAFTVGGHVYNLQDWENGILRGNRKAPYALSLQLSKTDPRLPYTITQPTCRTHFALNFGTRACPPVNFYTPDNLDEELDLATNFFLEDDDHLDIDLERQEIRISQIFAWYKQDFVRHKRHYPHRLVQLLRKSVTKKQRLERLIETAQQTKTSIKVVFTAYDWSVNAKQIATFDVNRLKTKERSIVKTMRFASDNTKKNQRGNSQHEQQGLSPQPLGGPHTFPTGGGKEQQEDCTEAVDDKDDDISNSSTQCSMTNEAIPMDGWHKV